ncbi:MAG: hypothetical protein U0637_06495 [Phycisphaerales bacterium]
MTNRTPAALTLALVATALGLGACGTSSVWDRALVKGPDVAAQLNTPATQRTVPWERVEAALGELQQEVAQSDVHPDDWSPEKKSAAKARLLRALQISQDPAKVLILGTSRFRTTDDLTKAHKDLGRIAQSLNADMVVWSSRVLGKTETVVDRPVTSSTWGTGWFRDSDGDRRPDTFTAYTTSWIPMRVSLDETGAVAYFLRVNP